MLDVGCASHYGCAIFSQCGGREIIGVDNRLPALHYGRKFGDTSLIWGNVLQLPLPSVAFGMLTCFEVIEYVVEQETLLEEMAHVLKDDGILILATPNLKLSELRALTVKRVLTWTERNGQRWGLRAAVLRRISGFGG